MVAQWPNIKSTKKTPSVVVRMAMSNDFHLDIPEECWEVDISPQFLGYPVKFSLERDFELDGPSEAQLEMLSDFVERDNDDLQRTLARSAFHFHDEYASA